MKANNELFADVILPLPLQNLFTYEVPEKFRDCTLLYKRVTVSFGKKKLYSAIVVRLHGEKPTAYQTKEILEVLDDGPIITEEQYSFWKWISSYYLCSIGEVQKAALPSGLKLESETKVFINPQFEDYASVSPKEELVLQFIESRQIVTISEISNNAEIKSSLNILKSLQTKKAIVLEEKLKESFKPKTEPYVYLSTEYDSDEKLNNLFEDLHKAPKQMALVMGYITLSDYFKSQKRDVRQQDLLIKVDATSQILKALVDKGIFFIEQKEVGRIISEGNSGSKLKMLSPVQKQKFEEIKNSFNTKEVVLFHGVTSSGKTEVYIHLMKDEIEKGKQVLYLLPEIALTAQIIHRLRNVFGDDVGIYHSKFSDAERVEVYQKMLSDKPYKVILGVRSSVFLPYQNLGLIVVDEEHENTYKQFDPAPRYNARDVSIVLAQLYKSKVLLGTATPSIETYYNTKSGKYGLVELFERHKNLQMPEIIVADVREARRKKKMKSIFTPLLFSAVDESLANNEQVILFQNRRGFSPYLECTLCGWVPQCEHCAVSLTYHKHTNSLVCHYCGYTIRNPKRCSACGGTSLETRGFGTEKIEEEISLLFPDARIARMDLDSTRKKKAYETLIEAFQSHKVDILVGTQMVSKGLDFDNVSVVGILNADNMLNFPDFRAYERSFHLMTQVSGRAGRDKKQGKVIIQTSQPENEIISFTKNYEFLKMYHTQINERRAYRYPPFYRLINLSLKHKDHVVVTKAAKEMAVLMRQSFGKRVLGPESPVINRIQTYYIKNIILKVERERSFQRAKDILKDIIDQISMQESYKSLQVVADVDPM